MMPSVEKRPLRNGHLWLVDTVSEELAITLFRLVLENEGEPELLTLPDQQSFFLKFWAEGNEGELLIFKAYLATLDFEELEELHCWN